MINRLQLVYKGINHVSHYRQKEEDTGVLRRSTRTKVTHIWPVGAHTLIYIHEQESNIHDMKQQIINSADENLQVSKQ